MKHFNKDVKSARQGEVYFIRVSVMPEDVVPVKPQDGKYIIAHSETGHHHVVEATPAVKYYSTPDPLVHYLQVIEATEQTEALLEHLRSFDTHDSIKFDAGIYCTVTGRESVPEGWRKTTD